MEERKRWWETEGDGYDTDLDLGGNFVWDENVLKNAEGKKKGTKRSDDESEDKSSTNGEEDQEEKRKADEDDNEDDDNEKGEQTKTVVRASKRAKTKRQC